VEKTKKKASLQDTMLRRHGRWRACSEAVLRGYFYIARYHNVENLSRGKIRKKELSKTT
jgi:hypothetical protein